MVVEVCFVGRVHFAHGVWAGVRVLSVRKPKAPRGKGLPASDGTEQLKPTGFGRNDGKLSGVRYFRCPPSTGLFVRPAALRRLHR